MLQKCKRTVRWRGCFMRSSDHSGIDLHQLGWITRQVVGFFEPIDDFDQGRAVQLLELRLASVGTLTDEKRKICLS